MSHKRGTVTKATSKYLGVWVPNPIAAAVEQAIAIDGNTDKSKFVRNAIKEKLQRERTTLAGA